MSYYLGKVGRAGARLMSSCKDLYYDVNAAYLTGAVDIIVVRQRDGSLKSTPFHVRFGKLGVLRTGDLKEVEIEVNGAPVDVCMNIDESGRAFFVQPKASEEGAQSSSKEAVKEKSPDHVVIDMSISEQSLQKDYTPPNQIGESHVTGGDHTPPKTQESGESHMTKGEDTPPKSGHVITSDLLEGLQSELESDRKSSTGSKTDVADEPLKPSVFEKRHTDTMLVALNSAERTYVDFGERRASEPADHPDGTPYSPLPVRSPPIEIKVSPSHVDADRISCHEVCCSLPSDLEVLSDSALESESHHGGWRVMGALSDTEVEVKDRLSSKLWEWSESRRGHSVGEASSAVVTSSSEDELKEREPPHAVVDRYGFWSTLTGILKRRRRRRFSSAEDGIYLDDIDGETMDPEELSKFFPSSSMVEAGTTVDQTSSSGVGSSLAPSPTQPFHDVPRKDWRRLVSTLDDVAFSLCGGLGQGAISEDVFRRSQVSFADFCMDPVTLFSNPNLVVRVRGKYYSWQVAAPMIMSAVVFLQAMPQDVQSRMVKKYMPKKPRQSFWSFWGRGQGSTEEDSVDGELMAKAKSEGGTPIGSPRKWMDAGGGVRGEVLSSDDEGKPEVQSRPRQRSLKRKKYNLTNLPTSEQLASLPLKPGVNEMVFSITTKFQGTAKAQCTLYLWNYCDKIVISDIDGTITRSDVAGQVLPLLGKDWTQNGVVELFNAIVRNGYHIVYLSARAIGQAWYTKEFLRNVRRGSASLPDGPLFLAPFSLYTAFRKEVIEKRPEEFKIECLEQIRALFPEHCTPLHAGFGNKSSDVKSYTKVDIPRSRIFTVNHKGHLKYELSWTFQSSYNDLVKLVDSQFPPVKDALEEGSETAEDYSMKEDFTTFNFWRELLPMCDLPFELPDTT